VQIRRMSRRVAPGVVAAIAALLGATLLCAWADGPTVHAYFVDAPGCPHCLEAEEAVAQVLESDPGVRVRVIDVHDREGFELGVAVLTVAGLAPGAIPAAPALLIGDDYLQREQVTPRRIREVLAKYRATGTPDLYPRAVQIQDKAAMALPTRFRRWGILSVIVAGLVDGVNPCAFATLVFLLAYLGATGASGRRLLVVGLSFAAGVFLAYFAFGLGILHAALALEHFPLLRRVLYAIIGGGTLALGIISVRDYTRLRRGHERGVILQLPAGVKRRAHEWVRRGAATGAAIPLAAVAGAIVSALEIACTGQVYIPTIIYMVSLNEYRWAAVAWLVLYCVLFITPLLVLLGLALAGVSSRSLADMARSHAAGSKLLLACFFVLCSLYFWSRAAGW